MLSLGTYGHTYAAGPNQHFYDERPPEYMDPVENYLVVKDSELREVLSVLERLRMHQDVETFYSLIEAGGTFSEFNLVGDTAEQRTKVAQALGRTTAHYLASVGMTMRMVNISTDVGFDVLRSASKVIGGGAEFDDFAAVGEAMFQGTVEGIEHGETSDLITIRVIDASSGPRSKKIRYQVNRSSVKPGQDCIFFLSRSLLLFKNERNGIGATGDRLAEQFAPYCATETGYASTSHYVTAEVGVPRALSVLAAKKFISNKY